MPEIKNTFIKGKMNKDLDARLLPNGEYRDAQNILIGKSEGSDVGTLQTLKGNEVAVASLTNRGTIIGYCVDRKAQSNGSNRVFYFVAATDAANHAIYYHNTLDTAAPTPIVKGSFLNFSPTKLITGVNIIDDLLFFTDDSNQPRKINVQRAIDKGLSYYDSDFKIAVAKYYPYLAPTILIKHDQEFTGNGSTTAFTLAATDFPTIPTTKSHLKVYVDSELISTSNYSYSNPTLTFTGNTGNTSVLESSGAPKNTKTVLVEAENSTGMQVSKTTAVGSTSGSSTTVTLTAANNDIHVGQLVTGGSTPNNTTVTAINGDNLTISNAASLSSVTLTFQNSRKHLEDEFVRFAYRFKFKDGEYSLISPFTQHCFIPKTYNGSLSSDHSDDGLTNNQIKDAYQDTELESFTNDVTEIQLKIPLPSATSYDSYEISEIEILYKESDSSNIKSVAKIDAYPNDTELGEEYIYTYQSTLPYKTLPEDQITRVYDNVPLKAKAQEITAGRLVYGNFEQNHEQPVIDFEAGSQQKTNVDQKHYIQYPYHTIKQRRTYQVGIVLADIHGRQSPVILPKDQNKSSVTVEAKDADFDSQAWNGDCLNVTFNNTIPNPYNSSTNPLGWYSWKMVVKQIEQEYYTVYAPRSVKGWPNANVPDGSGIGGQTYSDEDKRSWLVLHGDNINKIPRDSNTNLQEAGTSASITRLYPKIINAATTGTPSGMSDEGLLDVISIGTCTDHGLLSTNSGNEFQRPFGGFHNASKDPLVAELPDGYGAIDNSSASTFNTSTKGLSVWETDPVKSALDIYFETSTSGLVTELNAEIVAGSGGPAEVKIDGQDTDSFNEGVTTPFVIGALTALDSGGSQLSGVTFTLVSVFAQSDLATDIKSKFDINGTNLRVTSETFYYGTSGDTYNVTINAIDGSSNSLEDTITVTLANVAPEFQNVSGTPGTTTTTHVHYNVGSSGFTATAKNGSHDDTTPQDTLGLTYYITEVREDPAGSNTDVTSSNLWSIGSTTGTINSTGYFAVNKIGTVYRLTLKVLDAQLSDSFKDIGYVDITISPFTTPALPYGTNFNGICNTSTPKVFYLTKSAASTTNDFEVGDIVYQTYSGGTLSNTFGGYIVTAESGGSAGDGFYVRVTGGAAGEVQEVDIDRDCGVGGP